MGRGHGSRRRGRHAKRDFWRAWREERQRLWEEEGGKERHERPDHPRDFRKRPFPRGKRARFWREFFHEQMGAWPEDHWAFGGRRFSPWHKGHDNFNPFVASMLSKGGGLLPLLVLSLLEQRPRYGNEIMEAINERTDGQWVANPGAIYPLMTMLEKLGFITGKWEDPRKRTVRIYQITTVGTQEMLHLKAVVRPKLTEAITVLQEFARDLDGDESEPPE